MRFKYVLAYIRRIDFVFLAATKFSTCVAFCEKKLCLVSLLHRISLSGKFKISFYICPNLTKRTRSEQGFVFHFEPMVLAKFQGRGGGYCFGHMCQVGRSRN